MEANFDLELASYRVAPGPVRVLAVKGIGGYLLAAIFGVIVVGLLCAHPAAVVSAAQPIHITEALGAIATLKAFAAGCSALTGIEAIANGVPTFPATARQTRSTDRVDARRPARRDADRTVGTDHA